MRDLGYSLETAIADLIDNSISAGAETVDVICDVSGKHPVVVILDNGRGMTDVELLDAMRHGAGNPRQYRFLGSIGRRRILDALASASRQPHFPSVVR